MNARDRCLRLLFTLTPWRWNWGPWIAYRRKKIACYWRGHEFTLAEDNPMGPLVACQMRCIRCGQVRGIGHYMN